MEMQLYFGSGGGGGGGDVVDWFHSLAEFPALPLCMSPPPLLTSDGTSLPMAAAAPSHDRGSSGGYSSAIILREDATTGFLPMTPPPFATDDLDNSYVLPPLPADLATAGLDDALLLQPFSDIDLDAFCNVDLKPEPVDLDAAMVPLGHDFGEPPMAIINPLQQNNASRGGVLQLVHDLQAEDEESINVVDRGYGSEQTEAPPRRVKRSSERSGAAASGKSLDHIGFEELRKYFYMPITKAAREMNVGLTVLKKRCRELGVARWPHRKMKSLRSLILNIQEMKKGAMSSAEVQRELEALEMYCARMEENPAIELTEQTKKLRQACFKENYKRRRAAAGSLLDHCYRDFGHREMPMSRMISENSQSKGFFGC
ncbi:hypothetical protein QYE76_053290 [Lolium multiflorum]|uniref:RWP-RK domain-containing protein n=1 Tax=Lolium multiflorum TaxID=4521 RepID=A0AAD8SVI3_LOLMU|nr:hypothetical protein QYE76_053290 [Lolium multiflorum]